MNRLLIVLFVGMFTVSVSAFFMEMPQMMFQQGSQMMFPVQDQPCNCVCLSK